MTKVDSSETAVWRPHVTVACVINDGERYLMVEEEVQGRVMYNQPAGHLEDYESVHQAAVREALEETGWEVELTHLIGVHQWRSPVFGEEIVRFSFAARTVQHHPHQALDAGIRRALWMTRAEIAELGDRLRSPMILLSIDQYLAGQRLPLGTVVRLAEDGTPA